MTEAEKNEIVGLVMNQISSQAVDFDIETEQPQANDLLTAVRQTSSGAYVGVTIKWDDVARIATELANQAATRAEQAKTNVENMKSSVEQTVTDFNALADQKKSEVESVYQTDLNELKGDLADNPNVVWEEGSINATGIEYDESTRVRTEYIDVRNVLKIVSKKRLYRIFAFDKYFNLIKYEDSYSKGERTKEYIDSYLDGCSYIRITAAKLNSQDTIDAVIEDVKVYGAYCKTTAYKMADKLDAKYKDYIFSEKSIDFKQGYVGGNGIISLGSLLGVFDDNFILSEIYEIYVTGKLFSRISAYDSYGNFLGYFDKGNANHIITQSDIRDKFPTADRFDMMWFYSSNKQTLISDVQQNVTVNSLKKINSTYSDSNQEYWRKQRQRFNDKPIIVAYSNGAELGTMNTELTYINASMFGFEWIKGDVQPTKDGELVMCHDDGFTFDDNGYITTYNATSEKTRLIHDLTYEECMAFEYSRKYMISRSDYYRPKVCDLEKFLIVCKHFGVRPYIVIRNDYMDVVVPKLLQLLEYYDLIDNCIVNSFNANSIREVANQSNHRIMVSLVKEYGRNKFLSISEVYSLMKISPNCTINIYTRENTEVWNNTLLAEGSSDAINYAKSLGIVVGSAFEKDISKLLSRGIGLIQTSIPCVKPNVIPIYLCIAIANGVATVERDNIYGSRYTADVQTFERSIDITNIRLRGSEREFSDGVTPNILGLMPYTLTVTGDNVSDYAVFYNNVITINFDTDVANIGANDKRKILIKLILGI